MGYGRATAADSTGGHFCLQRSDLEDGLVANKKKVRNVRIWHSNHSKNSASVHTAK